MHELVGYADTQGIPTLSPEVEPIGDDSVRASSLHIMGQGLIARGELATAMECLRKAVELEPQRRGLLVDLGDALVKTGDFAEAVSVYQKAQDELGPDYRVYEKLADALLGQGNICDAIDALGAAFIAGVDDCVLAAMNITRQSPEIVAIKKKLDSLLQAAESSGISPLIFRDGWYFPRSDILSFRALETLPRYKGRPFSDVEAAKLCVEKTRQHRVAVDVGANLGNWSWCLADYFQHVNAFEPIPILQLGFEQNIRKENVTLHKFALGAAPSVAEMKTFDMAMGGSFISAVLPEGEQGGSTSGQRLFVKRLDDMQLQDVDFIKIDTEGFEAFVVQGAVDTITRCKPVMFVEQVWGARYREAGQHDAVRMLIGLGAVATALGDGANFLIEWP